MDWRLAAYRHWATLEEPRWQNVRHGPIDYQDISYDAAPKKEEEGLSSLDEVDPELRAMFDKLGISLAEQERLSGVAVDAIVDSVSVATTFQAKRAAAGASAGGHGGRRSELGGTYTVQTDRGGLARIDGHDADALGFETPEPVVAAANGGVFDVAQIIEALRSVYDSEIPVNVVVDLGLIYHCDAQPLADGGHRIDIKMSMTTSGCGMGDILRDEARSRALAVARVREVDVELVWNPPWDLNRLSEGPAGAGAVRHVGEERSSGRCGSTRTCAPGTACAKRSATGLRPPRSLSGLRQRG